MMPTFEERCAGAVLGAAVGDALGKPSEFVGSWDALDARWPEGIRGFGEWWTRDGTRFAPYTDDTQLAVVVLWGLLEARAGQWSLDPTMRRIAEGIVAWSRDDADLQGRAPGGACLRGAAALARGVPWQEAGGATDGGCGSVMRAWPFGLVFADAPERAERWAVAHSRLTHRDPIALAACGALARGMTAVVAGRTPGEVGEEMVAAARREDAKTADMLATALSAAASGQGPREVLDTAGLRGWAAHEAIAAAAYVFARHPDDYAAAVQEGALTPGDSDSIASIAGALVGARVGLPGLPPEWVRDVERSEALLELARRIPGQASAGAVASEGDRPA